MEQRSSVCSSRRRFDLIAYVSLIAGCLLGACETKLESRTAEDVKLIGGEPRCEMLGSVEGFGSDAQHARVDALSRAAQRGATHVRLERPHPDLEDGMTITVTATMFHCLFPDHEFAPDGYP